MVTVQSGATLEGSGTLGGPVTISNGGHLVGVDGQTLTMGALSLNPTSNLDVSLGAPTATGLFKVNGGLTLDGTLNVNNAGGFGAGTYRIIDYTGALTDHGLSLGAAPAGEPDSADLGGQSGYEPGLRHSDRFRSVAVLERLDPDADRNRGRRRRDLEDRPDQLDRCRRRRIRDLDHRLRHLPGDAAGR